MNKKCKCSLRGSLVGDGCEVCNPEYMSASSSNELLCEDERKAWEGVLSAMKPACDLQGCDNCKLKDVSGICPAWIISAKLNA